MSVVGVDFGAKNAVIAAAGRGGVDVLLNGSSNRLNPSMVGFDQSRSMGEGALSGATSNFKNTITSIKRLVGLRFEDPRAQAEIKRVAFTCVPYKRGNGAETVGVRVKNNTDPEGGETTIPIEAVAGMMIRHLGAIAAKNAAEAANTPELQAAKTMDPYDVSNPLFPQDWVIAVPSYYTDSQKRDMLAGCAMAGVNGVQRLMHETTATALAYGIFKDIRKEFTKDKPTNVMFIDIGSTDYQVAVVAFEPGKLTVKSTHHDADLGGRDFDQVIAQWVADGFQEKYKGKLSAAPMDKPKVVLKLHAAAEKAKKTLSPAGVRETRVNLECLMDDLDYGATLKADDYEALCAPLLARLEPPIQRALSEAKLTPADLSSVEIVGGTTRIGSVKRTLAAILKLDVSATNNGLSTTMNADEAVARGAALQSAILSPRFKVLPYEIIDYQPFSVKIAWDGETASGAQAEGVEVEADAEGTTNEGDAAAAEVPATNSVVMFGRGSGFPCVRRVTLRRAGEFLVTASYDETATAADHGFPEGVSRDIVNFTIKAPEGAENKVRVNVKQDIHGTILLSSAQMVEEVLDEEVPASSEESKKEEGETKKEGEDQAMAEAEPPKKKKIKKTNLEFVESRPVDFSKPEIDKGFELETAMSNADRVLRETADMRNELESYIYGMRDKIISESHLQPYCTEAEREAFSAALEKDENWLYEDGFDASKSVYAEHLEALRKLGDPIERRAAETDGRPAAVDGLKSAVEQYKNWLTSTEGDEKFAHITDEERATCHAKSDETLSWMYDMLDKQGGLEINVDPAFTIAEVNAKRKELGAVVDPIVKKPIPKPPTPTKTEEAKEGEKKAEEGEEKKKEDAGTADASPDSVPEKGLEPMDTSEDKSADGPEPMQT